MTIPTRICSLLCPTATFTAAVTGCQFNPGLARWLSPGRSADTEHGYLGGCGLDHSVVLWSRPFEKIIPPQHGNGKLVHMVTADPLSIDAPDLWIRRVGEPTRRSPMVRLLQGRASSPHYVHESDRVLLDDT